MASYVLFGFVCMFLSVGVQGGLEPEDEICINKLKLDRKVIESLTEKLIHPLDNKDYNKYSECYWKEQNLMAEDGKIKWDDVEQVFEKKLGNIIDLSEDIKHCKKENKQGKSNGETAVLSQNCIFSTAVKRGLLPEDI